MTTDFRPLPAGEYLAEIIEMRLRRPDTPKGYVEFTFCVLQGLYQDLRLWVRLLLWDRRSGVAAFARADLGSICEAVGFPDGCDFDDVLDVPLVVKVSVRAWRGRLLNGVDGYRRVRPRSPTPNPRTIDAPRDLEAEAKPAVGGHPDSPR